MGKLVGSAVAGEAKAPRKRGRKKEVSEEPSGERVIKGRVALPLCLSPFEVYVGVIGGSCKYL